MKYLFMRLLRKLRRQIMIDRILGITPAEKLYFDFNIEEAVDE